MSEFKDYVSKPEEMGSINISEEVIASITAVAVADVDGVGGLSANIDIAELLSRKHLSRGVKLQLTEDNVSIDVHVMLKYGYAIPQIAKGIQDKVIGAVESMTGLKVISVNVHVCGVMFDKKDKKEKKAKE